MPKIPVLIHVAVLVSLLSGSCTGAEAPQLHGLASQIIEEEPVAQLDALQQVSESGEYLLRSYKSPAHKAAAQQIERWMKLAGMTTWHDAIGNVHGELRGANASDSALLMGSHYDTVKDAGAYDGALGVITAIAAVKALVATSSPCEAQTTSEKFGDPATEQGGTVLTKQQFNNHSIQYSIKQSCRSAEWTLRNVTPCVGSFLAGLGSRTHVRVVAFTDEEGVRFQSTFLGSRALAGSLSSEMLEAQDDTGTTLAHTLDVPDLAECRSTTSISATTSNAEQHSSCGQTDSTTTTAEADSKDNKSGKNSKIRNPEVVQEVVRGMKLPQGAVHAYVEAHLEQGPVLEASGRPVGIVSAIAGSVPMRLRKDPLPVAGALMHAMQQHCTLPAPRPDSDIMYAMHTLLRRLPNVVPLCLQRGAANLFSKLPDSSATWLQGLWTKVLSSMQLPELPYLVCTVGTVSLWPGASNVIPKTVNFTVDIRSDDDAVRKGVEQWLQAAVSESCKAAGLPACSATLRNEASSVQSSDSLTATLLESAEAAMRWQSSASVAASEECSSAGPSNVDNAQAQKEYLVEDESGGGAGFLRQVVETDQEPLGGCSNGGVLQGGSEGGLSVPRMTSGAGHDTLAMAEIAPVAMLFVRCRGGISHSPDEYVAPDDVIMATRVLLQLLLQDSGIVRGR